MGCSNAIWNSVPFTNLWFELQKDIAVIPKYTLTVYEKTQDTFWRLNAE